MRRCIPEEAGEEAGDDGVENAECGIDDLASEPGTAVPTQALTCRIPHSEFRIQLPRSRSASATRCSAIAYAAVRNVTPFCFARSRTPVYAFVMVACSSRFTCSCVQRYCWRFCAHS